MMTETEKKAIQNDFKEQMDYDELLNCMRCGFCLPSCPTYIETDQQELYSPRGRIALMKGITDGVIEPDEEVTHSLDLCLGCRACETVCPSGVKYGHLLEDARSIIQSHKKQSVPVKMLRRGIFDELFPNQNRLEHVTSLLGFYQRSGLSKVVRKVGFMNLFPESMATMERVLPEVPKRKEIRERPRYFEHEGERQATCAMFTGCLMDTVFFTTNNATIRLLQKAGCDVLVPENQLCCGALHGHNGELERAKQMAKQNIAAFEHSGADYIVTNAGGCGAFLIEYDHLLADDPEWADRAKNFVSKLKDISAVLVTLEFHKTHRLKLPQQTVTYQDSCHLRNVMHTYEEPRLLLQSIEGIHFEEMEGANTCCGSAGDYNIVEPEMAMQILDHKMEQVVKTDAKTIVTANPGCLLEMKVGIERKHRTGSMRAVHIVDLLLEALDG
ncbi:(Fe-S)-binding protein [Sporolactobacillus spathodeae]|uniref:Glycolate oxidase iron-sulfur subunit n=1 Tax=Sporolactobacillus spathodeae TaxID=1465502 RepID=A0ABS2Q964_9BACL|nr:(Fe-S)-binding protein [Sporolactobacillus spathodeae]MBM7658327.1 glycolate oxidase iron-sulfur subunit [Sporolactobacillus spathodeae]